MSEMLVVGKVEIVSLTRARYAELMEDLERLRKRVAELEGREGRCDCGDAWPESGWCRFCGARSRYGCGK